MFFGFCNRVNKNTILSERNRYLADFQEYKKKYKSNLTQEEFLQLPDEYDGIEKVENFMFKTDILEKMYKISTSLDVNIDYFKLTKFILSKSTNPLYNGLVDLLDKIRSNELSSKDTYIKKGLLLCRTFDFEDNNFESELTITKNEFKSIQKRERKYEKKYLKLLEKFRAAQDLYYLCPTFCDEFEALIARNCDISNISSINQIEEWIHANQAVFEDFLDSKLKLGDTEIKYSRKM